MLQKGVLRSREQEEMVASATCGLTLYSLQEGVTSQTSHWSRLYFMTFYIVTMVGPPQPFLVPWAAVLER